MKKLPWNESFGPKYFWDSDAQEEVETIQTLKSSLENPSGKHIEGLLKDCAAGLVMVMNELEEIKLKQDKLIKRLGNI